jgi:formylglycine-generating enzyme required for sulfatase activity
MHPADMLEANFTGLPPDELRLFFTLTRRTEAPQVVQVETLRILEALGFDPQMVRVPGGPFLMGSTYQEAQRAIARGLKKDWAAWEHPQHTVELSNYFIGKYPITNTEYQTFVWATGHVSPPHWDRDKYPEGKGDHPVVNVSWEDAVAYCQWLSARTGKPYRLPTEAEWEKAARGTDGRIYPWGDSRDHKKLNSAKAGLGDTTPVGQYSPAGDSPFGAADMAGNIWEWCVDWFGSEEYQQRASPIVKDPHGPENGTRRVVRGGAYLSHWVYTRATVRYHHYPDARDSSLGFRVAMSASPAAGGEG